MLFNFLGPSNPLDPINADVERTVNLFPEITAPGTPKTPLTLRGTPGRLVLIALSGATQIVQLFATGQQRPLGRCFGVSDTQFFELTTSGGIWVPTIWGTVLPSVTLGHQTTICTNGLGGNQIFIVSGGHGYIFNTSTNTFAEITDPDFPTGTAFCGDYMGGYFVVVNGANSSFQLSALEDGTSWDALMVAQRQNSQDVLTFCKTFRNELWLFGPLTTEVWYNSGAANFPFTPVQGALMQIGVTYPQTVRELNNALFFAGHEATQGIDMVYRATSYSPARISTHAVEDAINTAQAGFDDTLDASLGWTYQEEGHSFYVLRLPSNASWGYDEASQLWHERGIYNAGTDDFDPDPTACHVAFRSIHLVGDHDSGTIWQQSLDQLQDQVLT